MKCRRLIVLLSLLLLLIPQPAALADTWYHITLKAFLDPEDTNAAEWAWISLKEVPKHEAFPEQAALIEQYGGVLRGSVLALVRASAWRSSHSKTIDNPCNGRPSVISISWQQSWSERVYAMGGLDDPGNPDAISFGFTTRPVFMADGRWTDPHHDAYVIAGPPAVGDEPREEMRGSYLLRAVNYLDPLKHYEHCGKRWVEQYLSAFNHFHFTGIFEPGDPVIFTQQGFGPRGENTLVIHIVRSSSATHPTWQQQAMSPL
ncbi:hypothetical protein [Prosthecochloris sp. HL-130-GSB]|jgi:hypothetical protein|uniref:hypothetical protein n=1 Tax=Prosthecochloris sp. HL-130-GSB TaxID=1974213 RepID=UPI000A1C06A8|nr:hypothetical protein [Prosthecochloris sp. HL-130-GSB]ARM30085.1 hypothetical protein B9H02_00405 [Prosthecochloris sp. HL-130-GSB]